MTPEQRWVLMALFLRVDPARCNPERERVFRIASPPPAHGGRRDIALQVERERGALRITSVTHDWWEILLPVAERPLVAMCAVIPTRYAPEVRFGEVYVLEKEPKAPSLPEGYAWATPDQHVAPEVDQWLGERPELGVAYQGHIIAGIVPRPYPSTPFVGSPVFVASAHRNRRLAQCLIAAQAAKTRAEGKIPTALIPDRNVPSRRAFLAVGYVRAFTAGALSVKCPPR